MALSGEHFVLIKFPDGLGLSFLVVKDLKVGQRSALASGLLSHFCLNDGAIGEDGIDDFVVDRICSIKDRDGPSLELSELIFLELNVVSV